MSAPGGRWLDARRYLVFAAVALFGTLLDLYSKSAIFERLGGQLGTKRTLVEGWFDLWLQVNPGAAFGFLPGHHEVFYVISVAAFLALVYFVQVAPRRAIASPIILGMLLAGVVGNFYDRAIHGNVRDFLSVHAPDGSGLARFLDGTVGAHVWPTFNVADIFICIGAGALVVLFTVEERREKRRKAAEDAARTG